MDWSHAAMGVGGAVAGAFFNFLLKWKYANLKANAATSTEWQDIVRQQGERITVLEHLVERLHAENVECLKTQANLQTEVKILQAAARRRYRPPKPGSGEHTPLE